VNPAFYPAALAWLLTYAIHSTVLLGLVWLVTRSRRIPPMATDVLWKVALVGGLITAAMQQQFDLRPSGTVMLPEVATAATLRSASSSATGRGVTPDEARLPASDQGRGAPAALRDNGIAAPAGLRTISSIPTTTLVVVGWGAIALLLALVYAGRRLVLVGRLGDRQSVRDEALLALLESLRRDVGHRQPVRLTCTNSISSPVALGLSEICLPTRAISDLDVDQQRGMLAHELAHLGRRDPVWLDLASVVERMFFFQPLNRLARREMEAAAEYLCDEWAMRKTGSGLHLARCLAKVAEWIQASPLGVPVAGMAEHRSLLVSRIARLLDGGTSGSTRSRRGAAAAAAMLLIGMIVIAPGVSGRATKSLVSAVDTGERRAGSPVVVAFREAHTTAIRSRTSIVTAVRVGRVADSTQPADSAVVTALIARLKDEDARVRRAAAHSLGQLEDARAVLPLIETLKDPDDNVRAAAADALADFEDPRAITPLTVLLSDPSSDVKHNALEALSHFEHGVPVAPVVRALSDSDAEVRQEAVHLLQHLGDRSSGTAIARLIHDGSSEVRSAAITALGQLGDPAAGAAVKEALGDPSAEVRQNALEALDELKIAIPEATLLTLLRDQSADVRQAAAEVAGKRSIVGAIPTLRQMLDDPKADVRESAVEALGNMADSGARDALRAALGSKDPKVRQAAAEALGERR
jgi:HEAT repeat protein/beta-lactamase regulating signal transducer with metallopeptidase domain